MNDKDLETRLEAMEGQIGALTVSFRQLGENVKLLEYMKYIDFIMFRNLIDVLGAEQEWYDEKVNECLLRWKEEANYSLPEMFVPPEVRRVLISHVEETEIRIRNELIKIKDKFNREKGM